MTYAQLVDYLEKMFATDKIDVPGLLRDIETRLNSVVYGEKDVRSVTMEENTDTEGDGTGVYQLPAAWRKSKRIRIDDSEGLWISPNQFEINSGSCSAALYTTIGRTLVTQPGSEVEADYYAKIDALNENQGNWVADDFPGVYQAGCSYKATQYLYEIERQQPFKNDYEQAFAEMMHAIEQEKRTGPLAVRAR